MEQKHDIVLYQIDDTNVCVSVYFENETFWLTTKAMAELFGVKSQAITKHLGNIYEEEELTREATCSKKEQVQIEGGREVKRNLDFYNLDAIIAVGYRVNSKKATKFRQWATKTLKEYMTQGFVLNDDMLKNGKPFGKDYFDELLERIREIRAASAELIRKSQMYLNSAAMIMIRIAKPQEPFMHLCRISFISPLPVRLLLS